jgi:hypothetical protein
MTRGLPGRSAGDMWLAGVPRFGSLGRVNCGQPQGRTLDRASSVSTAPIRPSEHARFVSSRNSGLDLGSCSSSSATAPRTSGETPLTSGECGRLLLAAPGARASCTSGVWVQLMRTRLSLKSASAPSARRRQSGAFAEGSRAALLPMGLVEPTTCAVSRSIQVERWLAGDARLRLDLRERSGASMRAASRWWSSRRAARRAARRRCPSPAWCGRTRGGACARAARSASRCARRRGR